MSIEADDRVTHLESELIALEGAVEFLIDREKALVFIVGGMLGAVYGDKAINGGEWWPTYCRDALHPVVSTDEDVEGGGVRSGLFTRWERPQRRWTAYGSRAVVSRIAERLRVKPKSGWGRPSRSDIITALWAAGYDHRELLLQAEAERLVSA